MAEEAFSISMPDGRRVTAIRSLDATAPSAAWMFLYSPGAGSNVHDSFGAFACRALASKGIESLRFQFPYMEAGRRSPDRTAVLEATWMAAIEAVRERDVRLAVGGRSMGGRIASQVVAQGAAVDALALFAYPLHPPGRPEQRRVEHLVRLRVPTLFCSGTNDAFGSPDELRAAASNVLGAKLHLLEGADHSLVAPKSSGRSKEDVWREALQTFTQWLLSLQASD